MNLLLHHGLRIEEFKDWLRQAFAWDHAQVDAMRRDAAARGMNLNPADYNRPFPGSPVTVVASNVENAKPESAPAPAVPAAPTVLQSVPVPPPASWVKTLLLGSALLAGGTGAGLGIASVLKPTPPAPVQTAPAPQSDWQIRIVP